MTGMHKSCVMHGTWSVSAVHAQGREGADLGEEEAGLGVDSTVHDVEDLAHSACKRQRLVVGGHQVGRVRLAVLGGSVLRSNRAHQLSHTAMPVALKCMQRACRTQNLAGVPDPEKAAVCSLLQVRGVCACRGMPTG